jgi:putative CocE/NonD family hydrolase
VGFTDGADTVNWVKAQPWCNGKIGTVGGSALAITQMLLAPSTDGVLIQNMDAVPSSLYGDTAYTGGVFLKNMIEGWLAAINQPHLVEVYKSHPRYDDYWAHFDSIAKGEDINAPGIFVGGWYDIFQQGTINGFMAREARAKAPAKGTNILINENRFDLKVSQIRNRIFRHYLQGDEKAIEGIPAVHYYVMGADTPGAPGNEWRTADTWPPYETKATEYFLHPDGGLTTQSSGAADSPLTFVFDPANPVPTHGGPNLLMPSGAFDQRKKIEGRADILRFATEPLEEALEITGRVAVKLNISSDTPDTDFTAMLVDIYPDGRVLNVLDGIRRVKTRNGFTEPAPLLEGPDQIVELEIDLWSTAWIFDKGHRIGLHVSSSNFPRFEVNPNTGEDFPGAELRKATNVVHISPEHPSALVVPVR